MGAPELLLPSAGQPGINSKVGTIPVITLLFLWDLPIKECFLAAMIRLCPGKNHGFVPGRVAVVDGPGWPWLDRG